MKRHSTWSFFLGIFLHLAFIALLIKNDSGNLVFKLNTVLVIVSFSLACTAATIELILKEIYFSIFTLPISLVTLLCSSFFTNTLKGLQFQNPLFLLHLIASSCGESYIMIAAISSITYLYSVRRLKKKNRLKAVFLFPPLNRLDRLSSKLFTLGTAIFMIGITSGLYWHIKIYESFVPSFKHLLSFILLTYNIIVIALKKPMKLAGSQMAILVIIGFFISVCLILVPSNELHWFPIKQTTKELIK